MYRVQQHRYRVYGPPALSEGVADAIAAVRTCCAVPVSEYRSKRVARCRAGVQLTIPLRLLIVASTGLRGVFVQTIQCMPTVPLPLYNDIRVCAVS